MIVPTRRRHTQVIFAVVLVLGTVAVAVVFGLLFRRTAQYEELVLSYEAEGTAGVLIESYLRGTLTDSTTEAELPESVVSFAVYAADGRPLLRIGEAPDRLGSGDPSEGQSQGTQQGPASMPPHGGMQGRRFYHLDRDRVRLVRPLRTSFGPSRGPGRQRMGGSEVALVDLDASSLLAGRRARRRALVAVLVITLILAGLVVRAYRKLRRSELEAQRNAGLAQLGAAARTLTHEIRNPLAAIRLQAAILGKELGDTHQDTLKALNEEVGRISSLVDDVRTFLASSPGRVEQIDLADAVEELIARLDYDASLSRDGQLHPICIDPRRLRSILGNALDNAVEAAAEAGGAHGAAHSVTVTVESRQGRELLSVADTGLGIASEDREQVFDPFFTTKEGGSGIGLAVMRRFVGDAGGTVWLEDRPGGGTILRIEFPRGEACETAGS